MRIFVKLTKPSLPKIKLVYIGSHMNLSAIGELFHEVYMNSCDYMLMIDALLLI